MPKLTRNTAVLVWPLLAVGLAAADTPRLGVPASAEHIAAWDIDVGPDGRGLPPGSGTAREGAGIYAAKCASCHGAGGEGGPFDPLVGGRDTITSPRPLRTIGSYWPYATTIFDYVRRAMPPTAPLSLTDAEVYSLTAYLLFANGLWPQDKPLDRASLPGVRMPNRDGFVWSKDASAPLPKRRRGAQ